MKVNPKIQARAAALDALHAKQKCELLEDLVQEQLLASSSTFVYLSADIHALSDALSRIAERLLAVSSACPDKDFEVKLRVLNSRMGPITGRFVSQDPAYHGVNWFSYCNNDPINLVDKTGKAPGAYDVVWGLGLTFAIAAVATMVAYNRSNVARVQIRLRVSNYGGNEVVGRT